MHWPVASQCIAHGVKDQLSEAGADTSQFKVHSHHRWLWTKGLLRGISCRWPTGVLTPHLEGFITILLMIILPILAGKLCKWSSWVRKCSTHIGHICLHVPLFVLGFELYPVSHTANLTKYKYQFGEGPRGPKASEMSTLHVVLFFPFSQVDMQKKISMEK